MKLYVIPVESACNANCSYCITKFRYLGDGLLDLKDLRKVLAKRKYQKIEITGGGEPALHPRIREIIRECSLHAPTSLYTNGSSGPIEEMNQLSEICLSRAHYDDNENFKIMKAASDPEAYKERCKAPLKLSLMIHKSGIRSAKELKRYLSWAKDVAYKVVIRQLFDYESKTYQNYLKEEYVEINKLGDKILLSNRKEDFNSIKGEYYGLEVEFELRACSCENQNPVLHADGRIEEGWS